MGVSVVTPASGYPVTLTEAKAQCRVDDSDHDSELNALIAAACQYVEKWTGRSLGEQTLALYLDEFADTILLPFGPVSAVSSVEYRDTASAEQTLSTSIYAVDLVSDPQRIVRKTTGSWPATDDEVNAVWVTYVTGYTALPAPVKQAILLLIAHWFDNRSVAGPAEAEMPHAAAHLLANFQSFF